MRIRSTKTSHPCAARAAWSLRHLYANSSCLTFPHCAYAVGCRGLDAVKQSERVYLEAYTSLLLVPKETLVG